MVSHTSGYCLLAGNLNNALQTLFRFRNVSVRSPTQTLVHYSPFLLVVISTSMYWSMMQMGLSIVAACLPTLRPLFNNASLQGWYKRLRSHITLPSKISLAMRPKRQSDFDTIDSNDLTKGSGEVSKSPQSEILPAKTMRVTTHVYPLHDMETQTGTPVWKSTFRDEIEQTSLKA